MKINRLNEANENNFEKEKDNVADAMDVEEKEVIEEDDPDDEISQELNRSLNKAKRFVEKGQIPRGCNVLFVGNAGSAKTARVKAWAEKHKINLVTKRTVDLDEGDLGGIQGREYDKDGNPSNYTQRLANHEFDALNEPNSVLFLDEINRARPEVIGSLLMLIQDHEISDVNEKNGMRKLNFLFTVAAMNPPGRASYEDVNELDTAMQSRFKTKMISSPKKATLNYLTKLYTQEAKDSLDDEERLENLGRLAIAKTLLSSEEFEFDDDDAEDKAHLEHVNPLNTRTLSMLLDNSDGTKEDFLAQWNYICNPEDKEMAENILAEYIDVDDKANDALRYGEAGKKEDGDNLFTALGDF